MSAKPIDIDQVWLLKALANEVRISPGNSMILNFPLQYVRAKELVMRGLLILGLGPNPASFCFYFCSFRNAKTNNSTNLTKNGKSVDGVLGS